MNIYTRRRIANSVVMTLSVAATAFGLLWLVLVLWTLLENGLAGMSWNEKRLREPLKARVLEELTAMDIAPDVAETLAAMTPARTHLEDTSKISLALNTCG